jgi:hypothetical protein
MAIYLPSFTEATLRDHPELAMGCNPTVDLKIKNQPERLLVPAVVALGRVIARR